MNIEFDPKFILQAVLVVIALATALCLNKKKFGIIVSVILLGIVIIDCMNRFSGLREYAYLYSSESSAVRASGLMGLPTIIGSIFCILISVFQYILRHKKVI